jgi:hypothetical protein
VPEPEPAHRKRILREKGFEIATVVLLVVGGVGFLIWRDARSHSAPDPARSLAASAEAMEAAGGVPSEPVALPARQLLTFRQEIGDFVCRVGLVGEGPESPLETAVIWATPESGRADLSTEALQKLVDGTALLAQKLVRSSSRAVETAANTMEVVRDGDRLHDKGVGQTGDGWKVTYVTFRSFDEDAPLLPVLYLVLQRLSAASDPALARFNQRLYETVNRGEDVGAALRDLGKEDGIAQ